MQRTLLSLFSSLVSEFQLSPEQVQASGQMVRLLLHPQLYFFLSRGEELPHFLVVLNFKRLGWLLNQWMRKQFQISQSDSLIWLPEPELYLQQGKTYLLVMDTPDMLPSPAGEGRPGESSLLTTLSGDESHLAVLILDAAYCLQLLDELWEELALGEELERWQLDPEQIAQACGIARDAGADFVKTSTGFAEGPATPEAIDVMMKTVGDCMGVKASGGVRSYETAVGYLEQGCKRLGAGGGTKTICEDAPADESGDY